MKSIERLEEKLVYNMCQSLRNTQPFNTAISKENDATNFSLGYLNGLAQCIELIHSPEEIDENGCEPEYPIYNVGEAVLYQSGDKFELGIVKSLCGHDEYFVWYHTGDTAARTHARYMHKISNDYAFKITRLDINGNERG